MIGLIFCFSDELAFTFVWCSLLFCFIVDSCLGLFNLCVFEMFVVLFFFVVGLQLCLFDLGLFSDLVDLLTVWIFDYFSGLWLFWIVLFDLLLCLWLPWFCLCLFLLILLDCWFWLLVVMVLFASCGWTCFTGVVLRYLIFAWVDYWFDLVAFELVSNVGLLHFG